jgi:purine-nucleoside phosphorylase
MDPTARGVADSDATALGGLLRVFSFGSFRELIMVDLHAEIAAAANAIRSRWSKRPRVGIVLGTGLGGFASEITTEATIPYGEIPHFPESTVMTHTGQLVCGTMGGKSMVAMEGRFHYYEGYTMQQITFPVRVMRELGADVLILSNACGGMNPQHEKGDILIIDDHVNLMGDNPLRGKNDDTLGPRFPDMCRPYDHELLLAAERIALEEKIRVHRGVYVAVTGPNLETRAEYRFLRTIGADVVGMSTVPEVIVGVHAGMRILGLSVITDLCLPDALQPADIADIIRTANEAEPKLRTIVRRVVAEL